MRKILAIALISLFLTPLAHTLAQPIAIAELPVGSKLTYKLGGVYVGNKTYEVLDWSSSQGRRCKLVKVSLSVNASGSFFYRGINSTSEFCYDERGRPLEEVLYIPQEFNSSYTRVEITYWWEDEEVFPHRSLISLIGEKRENYDVLLSEGLVIKESGGKTEKFRVSSKNLSKVLPFVPERLTEPYVDLSSIRLKEGYARRYGDFEVKVLSLENVQTPAGLFPCYKVLLSGWTEDGLPYNSTVYVTVKEPRFTTYYITNIIGIKQTGYVVEVNIPEQGLNQWIIYLVMVLVFAVLAFSLKKRRKAGEKRVTS
ncbi:MAG: hypothetical protein QI197_00355 [Candidatus Korarchaeota archaeon]|nr:hypothetical protein [Candidatus Korarchaeota archaeon]